MQQSTFPTVIPFRFAFVASLAAGSGHVISLVDGNWTQTAESHKGPVATTSVQNWRAAYVVQLAVWLMGVHKGGIK
jgi:hypothetical protein